MSTTIASPTPLRRSPRIAELAVRRRLKVEQEIMKQYTDQIAALLSTLRQMSSIVNAEKVRKADWRAAEKLADECMWHGIDLWLGYNYKTTNPAILAASESFRKLNGYSANLNTLCLCAQDNSKSFAMLNTYIKELLEKAACIAKGLTVL
jgi:hypothetical protein